MKNLYLAKIRLSHSIYAGDSTRGYVEDVERIVWARDEDEARREIAQALSRDDPYGHSIRIDDVELSQALGHPGSTCSCSCGPEK